MITYICVIYINMYMYNANLEDFALEAWLHDDINDKLNFNNLLAFRTYFI